MALGLALIVVPGAWAQSLPVTGMVAHPGPVDVTKLKQIDVTGSFDSMSGKQTHRWTGPLLLDVVNAAGIKDEAGHRTRMRHVVLVSGSDFYAAAIALGEIDAKAEGKHVIVALTQDGEVMKTPRLVVPGDASLTRCVHDLAGIEVR